METESVTNTMANPDYSGSGEPGLVVHAQKSESKQKAKNGKKSDEEGSSGRGGGGGRRQSLPADLDSRADVGLEPDSSRRSRPPSSRSSKSKQSRHTISSSGASVIKPHVSQRAEQRPDEKLLKHQYKAQLQKQIDEKRRLKEERLSLEKVEEQKLQARIEQERTQIVNEQRAEAERKRLRGEVLKQREELTMKHIEESRQKAVEDRRKRLEEKRRQSSSIDHDANASGALVAEFDLGPTSADSPEWKNLSTYSNPHDEQVIKTNTLDWDSLLEKELEAEGSVDEEGGGDQDEIDDSSMSTYYKKSPIQSGPDPDDELDDCGSATDNDALSLPSRMSTARVGERERPVAVPESKTTRSKSSAAPAAPASGKAKTRAFLKRLKDALAREEERMRIIISKRAAADPARDRDRHGPCGPDVHPADSGSGTDAELELDEGEQICDCHLTDVLVSSSSEADTLLN